MLVWSWGESFDINHKVLQVIHLRLPNTESYPDSVWGLGLEDDYGPFLSAWGPISSWDGSPQQSGPDLQYLTLLARGWGAGECYRTYIWQSYYRINIKLINSTSQQVTIIFSLHEIFSPPHFVKNYSVSGSVGCIQIKFHKLSAKVLIKKKISNITLSFWTKFKLKYYSSIVWFKLIEYQFQCFGLSGLTPGHCDKCKIIFYHQSGRVSQQHLLQ